MKLRYLLAALSVAFAFGMNALTLPRIIGDNMMLQQKVTYCCGDGKTWFESEGCNRLEW